MRVVVVGATGNIGSSLVSTLADDPRVDEVVGIARRVPAAPWPEGVRYVAGDLGSDDDLAPRLEGADVVVHLAWLFQPSHRPLVTWRANAVGSARLLKAVERAGVSSLVYSSSVGAYSPGPDSPGFGRVVDESWPTHSTPTAPYGREKAYVERLLDAFEQRRPDVRVVRFRPAFVFQRAAATAQRQLFLGPFLPPGLTRPGRLPILPLPRDLRFQVVHADDVAEAFRLAVVGNKEGAFNLAADPVIDATALGELTGARTVELPRRLVRAAFAAAWHGRVVPTDPALLDLFLSLPLMDSTRARVELGWVPRVDAFDAVRAVLDGLASGSGGPTPPLHEDSLDLRVEELRGGVGSQTASGQTSSGKTTSGSPPPRRG